MTGYPSQNPVSLVGVGLRQPTPGPAKAAKVLLILACIADDGLLLIGMLTGIAAALVAGASGTLSDESGAASVAVVIWILVLGVVMISPWLLVIIGFFTGRSWSRVFGAVFYGLRTIPLVFLAVKVEEFRWLLLGITALGAVTIFFMFHPATSAWLQETTARRVARRVAALTPHLQPGPPQPW